MRTIEGCQKSIDMCRITVTPIADDNDQIKIGESGEVFEGTRLQFRDAFFSNAEDGQIIRWCIEQWKGKEPLWIRGQQVNYNEWTIPESQEQAGM